MIDKTKKLFMKLHILIKQKLCTHLNYSMIGWRWIITEYDKPFIVIRYYCPKCNKTWYKQLHGEKANIWDRYMGEQGYNPTLQYENLILEDMK